MTKSSQFGAALSERVVVVLVGVILALLSYQGKQIIQRVERLERNTTKIMVALGVPPVACNTLENGVKNGHFPADQEIKRGGCGPWYGTFPENLLDLAAGEIVH